MGLNNNFQTFEQLNHNNDKIMSKRPHKGPGLIGGRGGGGGGGGGAPVRYLKGRS